MKKQFTASVLTAFLLFSTCMQMVLTTGPTQPPVVADTLYVGRDGWGPRYADPVRAHDKLSQELIFNVYDRLIVMGAPVTNSWGTWDVHEQYWEFSPSLAINVPTRGEVVMVVPDVGINPTDPVCYWFEPISVTPPEFAVNPFYHINGWVDNNPGGILGPCDVLYIGEYLVPMEPESIVTKRTWHVLEYVPGDHLTLHHYYYDFYIRTDPVIYFYDESGNPVDTFDVYDTEYTFERGLVQDQYDSPMWKFYEPLFDQMNSDPWVGKEYELAYLIEDAIEVVSLDPPILRINMGIPFPDLAFKQIMCGTWASIVSKDFSIGIGCWDGDLFIDVNPTNGYPDWWDNWRHIPSSPYDTGMRYVGTGPYRVVYASAINNLVILQRNALYWRGWPAPDRKSYLEYIDIEYIADWAIRREAFKACQLDVCAVPRAFMLELLDPNDLARMIVGWGDPFVAHPEIKTIKKIAPVLSIDAAFFTFTVDPLSDAIFTGQFPNGIPVNFFNDSYVRKAFAYAFDRAKYLHEVWLDEAICRETPDIMGLVPDYYCHDPDPPWTYDIDIAKVIVELQLAMFTQDSETRSVWDWGGFHLKMYYKAGNEQGRLACEYVRDTFNQINVMYGTNFIIDIEGCDSPIFLEYMETFHMPLFITGWQANFADADDFKRPFMHSQGYFALFQNYTVDNGWAATPGPRTGMTKDILIDLAVKTPDGPEREAMYKDLDDIYIEDCPSLPIAQPLERKWLKYWVKGWYYNVLYPSDYYYHLYKEDAPWADVTGPTVGIPDGVVDIRDISYIAGHYGANAPDPARIPPYDPKWAPGVYGCGGCDVYSDRKIDMRDIEAGSPRNHDVAVVDVTPSKTIVGQGYCMNITVTVTNQGDFPETFNVTIYANMTSIALETVTLESGTSTIIVFTWNTTGFTKGNYTIKAVADTVIGEINTDDNILTDGVVLVGVPCDVTGPTPGVPDGVCNMRDIGYICNHFGTTPSSPNWDPNCDVTGPTKGVPDGVVNMRDIGLACNNFGNKDP